MRIINGEFRLIASDLVNNFACRHLSRLDFDLASNKITRPSIGNLRKIGLTTSSARSELANGR